MNKAIRQYIILFLLTVIAWFLIAILSASEESLGLVFAYGLVLAPIFGGLNTFYMIIVNYTGLNKSIMTKFVLIVAEIVVFFILYYGVSELLLQIPAEYRFKETPTYSGVREYFTYPYDLVYTFIFLTLIIYIHKKLTRETTHNKDINPI